MSAEKHSFKAAIKTQHHKKHIVVTGKVEEPTNSWTVSLTKANPQGINPKVLMLKLDEDPPQHAAGDIVTTYPVSFRCISRRSPLHRSDDRDQGKQLYDPGSLMVLGRSAWAGRPAIEVFLSGARVLGVTSPFCLHHQIVKMLDGGEGMR